MPACPPAAVRRRRSITASLMGAAALCATASSFAPTTAATPTRPGFHQVAYHGYRITTPVSWPVYDLAARPRTCVRFDRDAVYLGVPAEDQDCPAHAAGRANAVLIQPDSPRALSRERLEAGRGTRALRAPAAHVLITASAVPGSTAVERALRTGVTADGAPAPTVELAPSRPAPPAARGWISRGPATIYTGHGFDTCHAPSLTALRAWSGSRYHAVGVYVGGVNRACGDGNLSASWVRSVSALGWRMIPIYVGYQAPCAHGSRLATIDSDQPDIVGGADAEDAAARAASFGFRQGSAIYFDLEGYQPGDVACRQTVISFVSAWSRRLRELGYRPGVYSGAKSGIADLANIYRDPGYDHPSAIWIARWDRDPSLTDPMVPDQYWNNHQRMKQYQGSRTETHGGVAINLDPDFLDAPVAARP